MPHSPGMTRRRLLKLIGCSATALPVAFFAPAVADAQGKTSKSAAQYQTHPHSGQQCSSCKHFQPPHSCKLVKGDINPNGWCVLYAPKSG